MTWPRVLHVFPFLTPSQHAGPSPRWLVPRKPFCFLLPQESQGPCPTQEDLQEVQQSQGPGTEGKEIGFMTPFASPPPPVPPPKGPLKPLQITLTGRPGGPGSPGWPWKSNGRGSEAGVSGYLLLSTTAPPPDRPRPVPRPLTLTPGIPTGPGSPLAPVRPWGRKRW